jgi:hypothetical protein
MIHIIQTSELNATFILECLEIRTLAAFCGGCGFPTKGFPGALNIGTRNELALGVKNGDFGFQDFHISLMVN